MVIMGSGQPRGTAGIVGHRARSFLRPGTPVIVFMTTGRQVKDCRLILMNHSDPVMASHMDGGDGGPCREGTAAKGVPEFKEIP